MIKKVVLLIISALLVGCSLYTPTEIVLPIDPPQEYQSHQGSKGVGKRLDQWWQVFKDDDLNLLMEELFARNLELTQAHARLEQVEAVFKTIRSARRPNITAAGSMGRSQQPGLSGDFTGDNQQLSLAAAFEVDLWGKLAARSQAAELDFVATQLETQTLYLGLSARLADLYFLATEQRAQLALTEQSIASFAETAERVESRYRLGLAPALDMYQTRQSLAGARAARYLYQARLAEAEHAIAVLLGRYPESDPEKSLARLPDAPTLFATGIPAELISQRPDLQAALKRVEAADARVAAAIADRFPSISLAGNFGTLRQDVTAGLLKGEFWSLLGNLALPLVDGGRRIAEVDRSEAKLKEAIASYQQKVLVAFQDVEDALANNYATAQRVTRLLETAQATEATLRLSTDRYLSGLADYLPVLTAQRADFEAQSRLLSARRQALADRISLARALGGSWMQNKMNSRSMIEKDTK
jgi:NodT family efflux transporter outer membrane factor (OMF) lipoprotein